MFTELPGLHWKSRRPSMSMTGSRVGSFDDPDAYAAAIHNAQVRVLPSTPGAFHARLTLVRLNGVHLAMGEESVPRLTEAEIASDRLFFRVSASYGDAILLNGNVEPPDTLLVATGGYPAAERSITP